MRPATALCLLALLVTGASLCNRRLPSGRGQQAPSLPPSTVRRSLTTEEAARLALGRAASAKVIERFWLLPPEEAARIAMAWPHALPSKPPRIQ